MSRTFKPLAGHKYHEYTEAMLRFVIKDAREAAACMRNFDMQAEGKYLDQVNDAITVLAYRQRTVEASAGRYR